MDAGIRAFIDKQAIAEALYSYCHGIDRCDGTALQSAFWPDATLDYGAFTGSPLEFSTMILPVLADMTSTMHSIGNIQIALDGDSAKVETYCIAYHFLPSNDGPQEMVVGGRYLDTAAQRDGDWRIVSRRYVHDWNRNSASSAIWDSGMYAALTTRGQRHPEDPYDTFMEKI